MLASTAKISVPNRRPAVNSKPATDIEPSRRRCQARMAVVCDTALSPGARLLYVLLDDYAGLKAECWPSMCTVSERLGCTARNAKRWLAELVLASHVHAHKTRTVNRYRMAWAVTELSPHGAQSREESAPFAVTELSPPYMEGFEPEKEPVVPLPELEPEPEPACPTCRDTGWRDFRRQLCDCAEGQAIRKRLWAPKCRV